MIVRVKLFAAAREAAGASDVAVEVGAEARAADVLAALARGPAPLAAVARRSRLAVNQELAPPVRPVAAADEIALIPPVGGG